MRPEEELADLDLLGNSLLLIYIPKLFASSVFSSSYYCTFACA